MAKQNNIPRTVSLPKWATGALQSTAYFVGYRLSNYNLYHLSEGTLVDEFVTQVQNRINNLGLTSRERMYKELSDNLKEMGTKRADITLFKGDIVNSIIEVKRAEAPPNEIEKDLRRLIIAKKAIPEARCFLVILSQKNRPIEFVSINGNALRKAKEFEGYYASTIRVCKSTNSFKGFEKANYACLIEVSKNQLTTDN